MFGVSADTCAVLWALREGRTPPGAKPVNLLWGLLFLKLYETERVNSFIAGTDEKTFRKWTWIIVKLLADLPVVSMTVLR